MDFVTLPHLWSVFILEGHFRCLLIYFPIITRTLGNGLFIYLCVSVVRSVVNSWVFEKTETLFRFWLWRFVYDTLHFELADWLLWEIIFDRRTFWRLRISFYLTYTLSFLIQHPFYRQVILSISFKSNLNSFLVETALNLAWIFICQRLKFTFHCKLIMNQLLFLLLGPVCLPLGICLILLLNVFFDYPPEIIVVLVQLIELDFTSVGESKPHICFSLRLPMATFISCLKLVFFDRTIK